MFYFFYLFAYTFCLALFLPVLFSFAHFLFFTPFLILSYYRLPLTSCLWWALICGFIIDLLSSQTRLGTYAINYCMVTLFLYRYKFYFFEDRLSTLPIMTFCFVSLSTVIQTGFFLMTEKPFFLSWEWVKNDLFLFSFQNILYVICAFTFPYAILSTLRRQLSFRSGRAWH